MRFLIFIYIICIVPSAFGQLYDRDDMRKYYPVDTVLKKAKVRSCIDTTALGIKGGNSFINEYDEQGRETAWYYNWDSIITRYRYERNGNTLLSTEYSTKYDKPWAVYGYRRYVYNAKGKAVLYQTCNKNYTSDSLTECTQDKLFYDDKGRLTDLFYYSSNKYRQPLSPAFTIADSLMKLETGYHYTYYPQKKLVVRKEVVGDPEWRSTDNSYYDQAGRLVKNINTRAKAYAGEFLVYNARVTHTVKYEAGKKTVTDTTCYGGPAAPFDTEPASKFYKTEEYLYYSNGVLKGSLTYFGEFKSWTDLNIYVYKYYDR